MPGPALRLPALWLQALRRPALLLAALLLPGACGPDGPAPVPSADAPAGAAAAAPVARNLNGSVPIAARHVPLPPGSWRVVAERGESFRLRSGASYPVSRRTLIQERDGQLVGIVGIVASEPFAQPLRALSAPETCSPRLSYRAARLATGTDRHDCIVLAPYAPGLERLARDTPQAKVVWPAVATQARERGLALPAIFACGYHSLFDQTGWLEVSYCWNGEAAGLPRDGREWERHSLNPRNLGGAAEDFITRAGAWMNWVHPVVQRGFRGQSVGVLPAF